MDNFNTAAHQEQSQATNSSRAAINKNQQQQAIDQFHQNNPTQQLNIPYRENILSLSFNQDGSCLAVGTTRGFRIYNVSPFRETFRREGGQTDRSNVSSNEHAHTQPGGIGIVEMLFRCNLLAIVGGGSFPQYPANKVMIYDDHQSKCIGELSFRQKVVAVRLRRDRIAAVTSTKVYLYNFADLSLLDQIHTIANPRGLLALSSGSVTTLACPSIVRGHVRLELYSTRKSLLVEAHETELAALSLSMDGMLLGTASVKGTLIRVFDARTGDKLHELRRGAERANIACIAFSLLESSSSANNYAHQWLATCSDKGTAHVFSLSNNTSNAHKPPTCSSNSNSLYSAQHGMLNDGTSSSYTPTATSSTSNSGSGGLLSIPSSYTWNSLSNAYNAVSTMPMMLNNKSYSQVRGLKDPKLCTFVQWSSNRNNGDATKHPHLAIVGGDGSFWLVDFEKGGEAERLLYHSFFHNGEANGQEYDLNDDARGGDIDDNNNSCDSIVEEGFVTIDSS